MVNRVLNVLEETVLIFLFFNQIVYSIIVDTIAVVKDFIVSFCKDRIKTFIVFFTGEVATPVCTFQPGYHTVVPDDKLSKSEWLNDYKVSFMHGWRSAPVYIEDHEISNLQLIFK
jgi:hypothetical protein